MECIDENELYQKILSEINRQADDAMKSAKTPEEMKNCKNYNFIRKLGFETKQFYTIKKFCQGKQLDNGMKKPLSDSNLERLMKALGMSLVKKMYLVQF